MGSSAIYIQYLADILTDRRWTHLPFRIHRGFISPSWFIFWQIWVFQFLPVSNVSVSPLVLKGLTVNSPRWSRGLVMISIRWSPKGVNMFVLFAPFRDVPSGGYRIPRLHRGLFTIEPFGSTPSLYGSYSGFKTQNFLNPVVFPVSAVAIIFGCGTYFKPLRQPLLLSAAATGNR